MIHISLPRNRSLQRIWLFSQLQEISEMKIDNKEIRLQQTFVSDVDNCSFQWWCKDAYNELSLCRLCDYRLSWTIRLQLCTSCCLEILDRHLPFEVCIQHDLLGARSCLRKQLHSRKSCIALGMWSISFLRSGWRKVCILEGKLSMRKLYLNLEVPVVQCKTCYHLINYPHMACHKTNLLSMGALMLVCQRP